MGTIASVLQWTCSNSNCRYINPTESLKCINCGNIRRIKIPTYLASPDDYDDDDDDDDDDDGNDGVDQNGDNGINDVDECDGIDKLTPSKSEISSNTGKRTKSTKLSSAVHCDGETLPGYVEINSNG